LIDPANARECLEINLERHKIYFEAKTKILYTTISSTELYSFKVRASDFLVTVSQEIKKRFDFKNETQD